jgi:hypothetical protein
MLWMLIAISVSHTGLKVQEQLSGPARAQTVYAGVGAQSLA